MKCIMLAVGSCFALLASAAAGEPVAIRIESFLVAPSHLPSAVVLVRNLRSDLYHGTVRIAGPIGWRFEPEAQTVEVGGGAIERLSFLVKRASGGESNAYPLTATAVGAGRTVKKSQNVMTASAPYFKPEIDGQIDDWQDAIPVAWTTKGKRTVIRTFWNRRQFTFLIEVEEDQLLPPDAAFAKPRDAIQIALSPEDAETGESAVDVAVRYEFLMMASGDSSEGVCFQLAEPGRLLSEGQRERDLTRLQYEDAQVAVRREGSVTYYECSLPFRPMRDQIRPSEGREFCLSVLIHDPDGTGLRDWGTGAGLWPCERSRLAWSVWHGATWGDAPPFDNKIPWGLCSSKY
ncbi:MAG: hypothetical protein ACC628_04910 [Pirellulaceae bacterium]